MSKIDPLQCKKVTLAPCTARGQYIKYIDMARMIGFMATWTTYGMWLQGSTKGYVKDGITHKANPALGKSNEELLKHEKIKIPEIFAK